MKTARKILEAHPRNLRLADTTQSNAFQEKHILAAMEEYAIARIPLFLEWTEENSWFKKSWFSDHKEDGWMNKISGARMTTAELIAEFNTRNPA